jgi:hypothetical protein
VEIAFKNGLRADGTRKLLLTFAPEMYRLKFTKLYFDLLLYMGVKLGMSL